MMHRFWFTGQWAAQKFDGKWLPTDASIEVTASNASAGMREAIRVLLLHEREVAFLARDAGGHSARGLIKIELFQIDGDKLKAEEYRALGRLA